MPTAGREKIFGSNLKPSAREVGALPLRDPVGDKLVCQDIEKNLSLGMRSPRLEDLSKKVGSRSFSSSASQRQFENKTDE